MKFIVVLFFLTFTAIVNSDDLDPPSSDRRLPDNLAAWGDPECRSPPVGFSAHGIHALTNADAAVTLSKVRHLGAPLWPSKLRDSSTLGPF
ncbi:MAG: hypothetical protein O3C28_00290, partial [Proteobacteria bacterium]|nr:hypothetical protein [Pseudomonadota bacterium]